MKVQDYNLKPSYNDNKEEVFRKTRRSFKDSARILYKIDRNEMLDRILNKTNP
jgi:hypothetical protein